MFTIGMTIESWMRRRGNCEIEILIIYTSSLMMSKVFTTKLHAYFTNVGRYSFPEGRRLAVTT